MLSEIYWIDNPKKYQLAIMARPRSGDWLEDEISNWQSNGIKTVVSLLETEEIYDLELQQEQGLCIKIGLSYLSFPIADRSTPSSMNEVFEFINKLSKLNQTGALAIHCRAGIGRSAIIAAAILILNKTSIMEALDLISNARRVKVPDTEKQIEWLREFESYCSNL